jgi:hypothetical protein
MAGKQGMHTRDLNPARQEEIRAKIKSTLIVNKLENHILNGDEMSSSQVSAALGLLKKTTPDLSALSADVKHAGTIDINHDLVAGAKEILLQRLASKDESAS